MGARAKMAVGRPSVSAWWRIFEEGEGFFGVAFGFDLFEDVDEALVAGTNEIGGSFHAFDELAVHVLRLNEIVAVDEQHVGVGEEIVGKIVFVLELLLILDGVARDAQDDDAGLLKLLEGVAEAAGFDGAAGGVGARVEEEDDGLAFEIGEGDVFAVLVLEGEVFYFVADVHVIWLLAGLCWRSYWVRAARVLSREAESSTLKVGVVASLPRIWRMRPARTLPGPTSMK